jgi:hypothetical protein
MGAGIKQVPVKSVDTKGASHPPDLAGHIFRNEGRSPPALSFVFNRSVYAT